MAEGPRAMVRYGVAVVAAAAATGVRMLLDPALEDNQPFVTFFVAVLFTAWYGGLGPSLLAVGLGAAAGVYFFLPPRHSFEISRPQDQVALGLFVFISIATGFLCESLLAGRRALARLQAEHQARLEEQVRQRTAELRHSEEKFRLLVEGTHDYALFLLDPQGHVTSWNPGAERIKGYKAEEIVGQHFSRFYPAEEVQSGKPARELEVAAAEGKSEEEGWRLRKDGSRFWASVLITALRDEAGDLRGFSKITRDMTARKEAEETARRLLREQTAREAAEANAVALRTEREWLRVTLESIGDAVIATDAAGHVTLMNPVATALTGWAPDEARGRPMAEVFRITNEQTGLPAEDPVARVLREGVVIGLANHTVLTARDGTVRPIDDSAAPIKDGHGRVLGVVVVFHDVTEKRAAENAVRRSEERLRLIVEHSPAAVAMLDRNLRYLHWSRRWVTDFGLTGEDLRGRSHYEVFPDLPAEWAEVHRRCLAGAVERSDEDRWVRADGREEWLRWEVEPWRDDRGAVGGILIFSEVITQRKHAETARREVEERLRGIFEQTAAGIALCDLEGGFELVNRRFCELTGRPAEELYGLALQDVTHPDDRPEGPARMAHQTPATVERRYVRPDGSHVWVNCSVSVVHRPDGAAAHALVVAIDISDRKTMEMINARLYNELREADRRKDEFLATLAHELRNPLAPIRNSLHILRFPGVDTRLAQQATEMMARQVDHIVRLVDDLLEVSRVVRGKIELRPERLDLAAVVRRAVEMAQPALDANGQELVVTLPERPVSLWGDAVRLTQVLNNLLNNAAKYTDRAGRVWLEVEPAAGRVEIRVRDTGIGIPADLLGRVFDLFVQGDRSLARTQGGLGIGLTLVRKLVELHGGTVEARSAGPGRGSEFIVRLPTLPAGEPAPAGAALADGAAGREAGLRVLVVDDNVDAAESLALMLRLWGDEVLTVHDGPAALLAAAAQRPDVVLLDIGMPGMDGYEVARRLRADPAQAGAVLVAVTGWGQADDRRRSQEAGFAFHLTKPVDPGVLEEFLHSLQVAP
jgi:PAS domain S-box-containing protein